MWVAGLLVLMLALGFLYKRQIMFGIKVLRKLHGATGVLRELVGVNGVWASSVRYRHQCWTRDSCLAVFWPFLHFPPLKTQQDIVKRHLTNLAKQQRADGRIPIVFQDDPEVLLKHLTQIELEQKRAPYALKQLRNGQFEYITKNTRDSEALFIAAALSNHFNDLDASVDKAFDYLESVVPKDEKTKLILGGDWRDTCLELDNKPVLSNAVLLYRAHLLARHVSHAEAIKFIIQRDYWDTAGGYFRNYPDHYDDPDKFVPQFVGQTRVKPGGCDRLGNALCVLYDIATPKQSDRLLSYLVDCSRCPGIGIDIGGVYLSAKNEAEQEVILRDRTVIWPWIHNLVAIALHHHIARGQDCSIKPNVLEQLFEESTNVKGFPEWCDIRSGNGYGSPNQTWSAATYIQLCSTTHPSLTKLYSAIHSVLF